MLAWFDAIEASGFGQTARSSLWLYPAANIAHVLGATLLVGAILVFDILILRRRYATAQAIAGTALPVAAAGLVLILLGASVLFAAETSALVRNPVFLIKMALAAIALANIALYHLSRRRTVEGVPSRAPAHAALSAILWIAIVIAGRYIAYV